MEENERMEEQYEKLLKQVDAGASQSSVDASQVSLYFTSRKKRWAVSERKKRTRPRAFDGTNAGGQGRLKKKMPLPRPVHTRICNLIQCANNSYAYTSFPFILYSNKSIS